MDVKLPKMSKTIISKTARFIFLILLFLESADQNPLEYAVKQSVKKWLSVMIQYLEEHQEFAHDRYLNASGVKGLSKQWRSLVVTLNSMGGALKDGECCKRAWTNMRYIMLGANVVCEQDWQKLLKNTSATNGPVPSSRKGKVGRPRRNKE